MKNNVNSSLVKSRTKYLENLIKGNHIEITENTKKYVNQLYIESESTLLLEEWIEEELKNIKL